MSGVLPVTCLPLKIRDDEAIAVLAPYMRDFARALGCGHIEGMGYGPGSLTVRNSPPPDRR
jgi:hypothetical protein